MKKLLLLLVVVSFWSTYSQNRWQKLNGPEGGRILAIFAKGDTILAGTGYNSGIIFYSTDRGNSWKQADFKNKRINAFIDTDDGAFIVAVDNNGLYKSYDFIHWNQIFYNGDLFVSLGKDFNGNLFTGTYYKKIFQSKDNGLSWNLAATTNGIVVSFLRNNDSTFMAGSYTQMFKKEKDSDVFKPLDFQVQDYFHLFPGDSNKIYANTVSQVFMSSDYGQSWKTLDTNKFLSPNFIYNGICNKKLILGCDDMTYFGFGGGWGVAISDDNGLIWRWNNNGLPPKYEGVYAFAKSNDDTYAATISAGVYKSTDFGDSWFPINNGIHSADVRYIAFDNQMNMYAACYSNGLYKSTDYGNTWEKKNIGFNNSYLWSIVCDDEGILYVGAEPGTYRSTDSGESWQQINNQFFILLYKDKLNRLYGMSYGSGMFRSTDQGNTWNRLDKGFISGLMFGLAFDSSGNIYAGTRGGAIYKSTDDGVTWLNVYQSNSTENCAISTIAIAPNGYIFANNLLEGILRSTDDGNSFQIVKSDPGIQGLGTLAVNDKGEIYASGSNSKFVCSKDNGNSWSDVTDNLALTSVQDIKFDKDGNMFLATDESVWRSNPDFSVSVKEEIKPVISYSLSQNYPNPFNPTTEIKYSIPVTGNVSIKVYDILGKEIFSLVNEQKEAGEYTVNFNGSRFPSGVYFYTIRAGNFTETKKLMLLK